MATMKNKPVSFNLDNQTEKHLYKQMQQIKNFSGYVKMLIADDLKRQLGVPNKSRTNAN